VVYSWKRKRVFGTCLVDIGVVDAHPKHPAGLGDDNRVREPPWMVGLSGKASVE
jgi:hypothetical protein